MVVNDRTPTVWFAGNPYKRGVISTPGGATPLYVFRYGKQRPITNDPCEQMSTGGHTFARGSRGQLLMKSPEPAMTDTRYPSPRRLRRALAFILDVALHLSCGLALAYATIRPESLEACATSKPLRGKLSG